MFETHKCCSLIMIHDKNKINWNQNAKMADENTPLYSAYKLKGFGTRISVLMHCYHRIPQ